jgi:hypothetical protein
MKRAALKSVTPMIPAGANLKKELLFYCEQLGFSVSWQTESMVGISRNEVAFNLIVNTNRQWADNSSFSIGVSDLEALYVEYRAAEGAKVGPLEMKAWGRREFHMIVPSGVCLQFFQQDERTS